MNHLMLAVLLAEEPNRGPDYGKASPVGLLVVVLLLIGLFLLLRSMNRHLKKVPPAFDAEPESPAGTAASAPDTAPDTEAPPRESSG